MTIQDDRLLEGQQSVREESAEFLAELEKFVGKKRPGCHTLKVLIDDDGYIETVISEHQGKRKIRARKK